MKKVHWIHISDLHYNKVGMQADSMREKLPQYIEGISNKNKIDYIFFTGDIRYAPQKTFPKEIVDYFEKLCLAAEIDKKHLFVVLGNHDVNRDNAKRLAAINELEQNYVNNDSVIDAKYLKQLKKGREKYFELIGEIITPEQLEHHKSNHKLHFLIETDDFNVVHVDSILTYSEFKQDEFIIGTYALKEVLKTCNKEKPTIILSHYSLNSFNPNEQKAVVSLLKDYNVQLWFAGHKHSDIIYKDRDCYYLVHSGNQTFEKNTYPGFVEGELDVDNWSGVFRVHKWNESSGWAVYQTLIDDTDLKKIGFVKDRTEYPFVLERGLEVNNKSTYIYDEFSKVKTFLSNYNGNSFLVETVSNELEINETTLKSILNILYKEGYIRPINYNKTQWSIHK